MSASRAAGAETSPAAVLAGLAPEQVYVWGLRQETIGMATSAGEGQVNFAEFQDRPLLRPGELVEVVPGLAVTQHSGTGKANQYFLRGFNLDHGTDFALRIDDFPVNFRTHGHGQGYLDVGGLIPETVERVNYRKGPYRADDGDFGLVGSARITTTDKIAPFLTAEYGGYGYRRLVAGGSFPLAKGDLLLVAQVKRNDGPWALPEKLRNYGGLAKYSADSTIGRVRASLNIYSARWQPTEQIPKRAIGTLLKDAYDTLDPTLRGRTERQILTLSVDGQDNWRANVWAQHYDWSLFSNFTFFLDDPVNGDQLRQYESMWGYGGRIENDLKLTPVLYLSIGAEGRADDIGQVGLDHGRAGKVDFTRSRFAVNETSGALYAEAEWKPVEGLMVVGGIRGDFYRFRTRALAGGAWSGLVKDSIFSPRIGLNYRLADGLAIYANYGQGFHSNDARGVTAPADPAPGLVKGNFRELG
ncbi:MAG TPA: TonB-dependent receptor, partial [Sphingobium sp.]|nr:TonB-dependent receptor [Sphingobium sp.]